MRCETRMRGGTVGLGKPVRRPTNLLQRAGSKSQPDELNRLLNQNLTCPKCSDDVQPAMSSARERNVIFSHTNKSVILNKSRGICNDL